MVGKGAYRNSYINPLSFKNVSRAAFAALECLDRIAGEYSINLVELAFPYPHRRTRQLGEKVDSKINEIMQKYRVTVHLPMAPLHTPIGFIEIITGFDYTLKHGAAQVVIHPAEQEWKWFWQRSEKYSLNPAEIKEISMRNIEKIITLYKDDRVIIGIENMAGNVAWGQNPEEFEHLLDTATANGQTVGLCLDTGHAVNFGLDPVILIEDYSDKLVEVHFSDTNSVGGPDKHCALGSGKVDLLAVAKDLENFRGPVIVEVDGKDFQASWKWLNKNGLA